MNWSPLSWIEEPRRNIRFSFRALRRAPVFAAAVILTLMLCVGANTTIFSVLYGLVLKPLPFRDPGQLVEIYNSQVKAGQSKKMTSVAQYLDFKTNADLFEGFALWRAWTFNIGEETDPTRGIGARVTPDLFTLLGVQPVLGRFFTMEECVPGKDQVVVLTQSFWESNYGGDPGIVGKVIRLSSELVTIIGVAPRSMESLNVDATMVKPFEWEPRVTSPQARGMSSAIMYARVRRGVPLATAATQVESLDRRFYATEAPAGMGDFMARNGQQVKLGQVRAEQTKSVRTSLLLLQGGALFVLLLGCVNVASLMLARANARQAEMAIRQALGGGRAALARQMLTEAAMLSSIGASIGVGVAWAVLRIINVYTTAIVREVQPIRLDGAVLAATLLGSLAVALVIAILPVIRMWRLNLLASMQGGSRGASAGGGLRAVSGSLVIAQVALALILLVGASLLIQSLANVMKIGPGFDAQKVAHGRIAFNGAYKDNATTQTAMDQIVAKIREIPGVEAVGASTHSPINGGYPGAVFPIRGATLGKEDTYPTAKWMGVSPEYFAAMGIRVLDGRVFTIADRLPKARRALIVDRDFAEQYFPGRSAVGETFAMGPPNMKAEEAPVIVGVVDVAKYDGPENSGSMPFVYGPLTAGGGGFSLEVRTTRAGTDILRAMRAQLRQVDSSLPFYNASILQDDFEATTNNRRGVMWLLTAFAGIALALSAVGIYGMLAYDVTQRTREIGIRGAIGATRGQIVGLILKQGMWKAGMGLLIGLVAAFYLTGFMRSLLFAVKSSDPLIYGAVAVTLLLVALLASWLPARRAARIDPIVALRTE